MKIEKVSFDNINSLSGHFEIDLTHPSLTDSGLFVITGPTGAGKTSLLDAITYAIYGQTARQGRLTGSSNEIMTHSCRVCRAEAIVEKDGRRYLFTTEQKRRKTRVAGNDPFSTAERSVSQLDEDGKATLISKNKNQVDKFAAGLMAYENFCRCMMLAQGEFSRFLKAKVDERSETLATITGTAIYQKIGDKVQAHVAGLRAAITGVALLPVMDPAAREHAEAQRDAQEARCKIWQKELEELNKELAWHDALRKAIATHESCAGSVKLAQELLHQFTESGQPARIRAAEAAQGIRVQESARNSAAHTLTTTRQLHETEQRWLQEHPETELRNAAEKAAAELHTRKPELESRLKFLADTVQPLEDAISTARVRAREATRAAGTREQEATAAQSTAQEEEKKARAATATRQQAEQSLAHLSADAVLAEELPAIRQRLEDWQKCAPQGGELPNSEEIATRAAAEEGERRHLLAGQSREELLLRHNRLVALALLSARKAESSALVQKLSLEKAAADAALAALPSAEEAEAAWHSARERAQLAFNIQSMSSKLDELYREFCAGKLSHCPCCGSPAPHERPVQSTLALEEARQAEKAAQQELAARQKALENAREKRAATRASLRAAEQAWARLCQEQMDALRELGWQEEPANLAEQSEQLRTSLQRLRELDTLAAELQPLQQQDACRQALHEALRPCTPERPATLAAACTLVKQLTARLAAFTRATRELEQATRAAGIATERATLAASASQSATSRYEAAAGAATEAVQALREREKELKRVWQGGPASKESEATHAALTALQQQERQHREALHAFRLEREDHAARTRAAAEQLPRLQQQATQTAADFAAALQGHGFAHESAYTAALLPPAQLELLRQREATLRQQLATAEGACAQAAEQEASLRAQALSQESEEKLVGKKEELTGVLAEQLELLKKLHAELLTDDAAHRNNAEKEASLAETRRELEQWQYLYEILGGRKDGFKRYAQRITFNLLLRQANERLSLLSDRYTLVQDTQEELGLRVFDRYQDDEKGRHCSNLSGGESFIVSLALALGLAQMAGETRIDTLFLDEGFGTLDEEALEQVLHCLQSLQAGGKLIGIISHVEALKERICAHLELLPRGTTGLSTLAPHEAVIARPL